MASTRFLRNSPGTCQQGMESMLLRWYWADRCQSRISSIQSVLRTADALLLGTVCKPIGLGMPEPRLHCTLRRVLLHLMPGMFRQHSLCTLFRQSSADTSLVHRLRKSLVPSCTCVPRKYQPSLQNVRREMGLGGFFTRQDTSIHSCSNYMDLRNPCSTFHRGKSVCSYSLCTHRRLRPGKMNGTDPPHTESSCMTHIVCKSHL